MTTAAERTGVTNDEFITDIIDMAGYGIGYWASKAELDVEAGTYTVTEGDDFGDHETAVLSRQDISHAASRVINARPGDPFKANDAITGYVRDRDIDSDAADVVIQVAMFNEIRYG